MGISRMGNFWRNHRFGIVYGALLVAFTIYALLDVFLVAHPYEKTKATQQINDSSNSEGGSDNKTGRIITETEYKI